MEGKKPTGTSSLAKHLASCNESTRSKALRILKTWLPSHESLTEDEMKKIWKGLFYCVWHADKQQYQIELINRLSSLLVSLDLPLSKRYFEIFILTIRREWSGIDFLRLDKFYLLIRRFVYHLFVLFKKHEWDVALISQMMGMMEDKSLLSGDKYPAQGVNYHLVEVFLAELKAFLPVKEEVVEVLVNPFVSVLGKSVDKVLLHKIKTSLFGCLLENGRRLLERRKFGADKHTGRDEVELFGTIALKLGFGKRFFELGSSAECVQGNRKVLFGLSEEFGKLEKDLEKFGIVIEIEIPEGGEEDEVPQLVHISQIENGGSEGSSDKAAKKKKKKKKKKKAKKDKVESGESESESKSSKKDSVESDESESESKKSKKDRVESGESESESKKSKKKKKRDSSAGSASLEGDNGNVANGENLRNDGGLVFDETVISNLQMQFERVAAEVGMDMDGTISSDSSERATIRKVPKKRKRAKSIDGQVLVNEGGSAVGKSGEKNAKKVRFSMKNNLVWKPQSPLPPQSLRLPPSATPRGSALKKGIPAGPVIETPMSRKVKHRISPVKKVRKGLKSVSPSVKRLKKLRAQSA